MLELIQNNVPVLAVSVLLAGSFLGSLASYLFGRREPAMAEQLRSDPYGNWRPNHNNQAQYTTSKPAREPRNRSIFGILLFAALIFGATSAGLFAYKSPWPTETDMRHLAAVLHCDIADRVGLAPANEGQPGYHARNDRNGNGVSCETGTSVAGLTPTGGIDKLSTTPMIWPLATPATVQ